MKQQTFTRAAARLLLCALALNLALLLAACGGASATAMHLKKTEGTVGVVDGEGNDVALAENLGLYSGYTVATEEESYAWIDLDKVKLAKLDADSAAEIVQEDKHLAVNVQTGSLFFNVTEPLAEDETMEIATSSILVGIRGTCGWVEQNRVGLLEGTVSVTAGEQVVTVNAGEMAVLTENGTLEVKSFSAAAVPAFVRAEVVEDEALAAEVLETIGMDLSQTEPAMPHYAESMVAKNLEEILYTEWIDFANDGAPELLVIGIKNRERLSDNKSVRAVNFYIFPNDDVQSPIFGRDYMEGNIVNLIPEAYLSTNEFSGSLVEADGRQFLEVYSYSYWDSRSSEGATYYGFDAAGNWFLESVGYDMDNSGFHRIVLFGSDGTDREEWDCGPDDFAATRAKYSPVKQLLYSPDCVTVTVTAP